MIGGDDDIRAAPLIGDDTDHVLDLLNRRVAGGKDGALQMTGLINCVVVDVDHVHALYERLPISSLHADDVFILKRNTG